MDHLQKKHQYIVRMINFGDFCAGICVVWISYRVKKNLWVLNSLWSVLWSMPYPIGWWLQRVVATFLPIHKIRNSPCHAEIELHHVISLCESPKFCTKLKWKKWIDCKIDWTSINEKLQKRKESWMKTFVNFNAQFWPKSEYYLVFDNISNTSSFVLVRMFFLSFGTIIGNLTLNANI